MPGESGEGGPVPPPNPEKKPGRIRTAYEIDWRRDYDKIPPDFYEELVQENGRRERLVHDVGDVLERYAPAQTPEGQPARVLDIAAGTGLLSRELTKRGYGVTALDLSRRHLDYLRTREPSISTLVADMNAPLPVDDESFDGVTELKANRFIRNTDRFLREVLRVLKPGGTFVWPIFPVEGPVWKVKSGVRQHTSSGSLSQQAREAGFETQVIDSSARFPQALGRGAPPSYVIARK